ncbi:MAG: two pore domain potassium channel family protein [Kineosporiaceae bacterium]|nr:two pore domain potassium channel family protein [Kineosporiaceae bacterium]MBK7624450.1 two pore domain potassium channel family protein [Kineosporiaceae bacterium]
MKKASPWVHLVRWAVGLTALSMVVVLGGATAVWYFERDHPEANLREWHDSLWWAVVTVCTVGYGEHFPVTIGGRMIAVLVMMTGIAIIGAVAAMVAFGFGYRFAARLEEAVRHVESQQTSEIEMLQAARDRTPHIQEPAGLQELLVSVPDSDCAASLTWLLARLGWHPAADDAGMGWAQGGTRMRLAIRPWTTPVGVQGRLTFGAGRQDRLARIAREALRHGFHRIENPAPTSSVPTLELAAAVPERVVLRTASGFEVALVAS